jgi:hypothetical protein
MLKESEKFAKSHGSRLSPKTPHLAATSRITELIEDRPDWAIFHIQDLPITGSSGPYGSDPHQSIASSTNSKGPSFLPMSTYVRSPLSNSQAARHNWVC